MLSIQRIDSIQKITITMIRLMNIIIVLMN